jgi:hypothetical protein
MNEHHSFNNSATERNAGAEHPEVGRPAQVISI